MFGVWYPFPLHAASGVTEIFLLVLAVDVIIGPCITLVVFNPAKKELRRDMAIVVLLQLGALGYGMHTVFVARPAYLVFNVDRFDIVHANELTDERLAKVKEPAFKSPPLLGPATVSARRPEEAKERTAVLVSSLTGGGDIAQMPEYYRPYLDQKREVLAKLLPLEGLLKFNSRAQPDVEKLKRHYQADGRSALGYLPMRGKVADLTVLIDGNTAEVLKIVELNPW